MKLSAGITKYVPSWNVLLNQAGVSVELLEKDASLNKFPLIFFTGEAKINKESIINYLNEGGAVIMEAAAANGLLNISPDRRKIKYLFSEKDDLFNFKIFCDVYAALQVPSGANYLTDSKGNNTILVKEFGQGLAVVLPEGFTSLIFSEKAKRKRFYSRWDSDFPTEQVSQVSKGDIYHIFYRIVEYLFHKRNLPFIRLWQFPDGYNSIFGFRVDTDFASDEDISNLYKVISENNIPAAWFIETQSRENNFRIFKSFKKQEIGLHCYRHKIYSDITKNEADIKKGFRLLESNDFYPSGYTAPFGEWNKSLAVVLNKYRFNYSSEFSYLYDSLPSRVLIDNSLSGVLQIPVHPVSVGRLKNAGFTEGEMIDYYSEIINKKVKAHEPIFFYSHPAQKKLNVINSVFNIVNHLKIPVIKFNDYVNWWKKREAVTWNPVEENDKIIFNSKEADKSIYVHISFSDGKNYLSPISEKESQQKEILPKQLNLDKDFNPDKLKSNYPEIIKQNIIYKFRKMKL